MNIDELLTATIKRKSSDLHLSPGLPPKIRSNGDIINLQETSLSKEEIGIIINKITNDFQKK